MKLSSIVGVCLLLANTAAFAAQKCPSIETSMVDKGFSDGAPWRVMSGGAGECSFMSADTSVNFGYSHMASETAESATTSATEMRAAVADKNEIEPMLSLGEQGFTYQPKKDNGEVDRTSMFFYGHRGTLNVSGYLNLKGAITPAQRDFAANLIATTLGSATNAKKLAKETNCPYFDAAIIERLLPTGEKSMIVPNADSCIASADGKVITLSVTKDARAASMVDTLLQEGGCTVDALPKLGKPAGIAHHCSAGNPRAEVLFASGRRMFNFTYVPGAEPSTQDRATLVELAEFASRK
jgi:hypothetical protein